MRTMPKVLIALIAFVAAIGGTLYAMNASSSDGGSSSGTGSREGGGGNSGAAASEVWAVGDEWTIQVRQDAGSITPEGDTNVAAIPYRFEVVAAPEGADGAWEVHVTQDGAEGPFAKGWNLWYVEDDGAMVLDRVSIGTEPPLEAELASIVLGPQFPYEVRYDAPPKERTVDAADLLERSQLPPGSLPDGSKAGAAPPAEAPATGPNGVPAPPAR
jgi:hypothetical protein